MPTQDEVIARHIQNALTAGELQTIQGFGKPLMGDSGWEATPEEFRMPFKILKNAGYIPVEVEMLNQKAALTKQLDTVSNDCERVDVMKKLSVLEQSIAMRLETIRLTGKL
jgi:hypothetical protein